VRAVQISEFGGPEVLQLVELPDPSPGEGLEVVDVTAAGVNYADTHATDNSYLQAQQLPQVPGSEVAGRAADGRRVVSLVGSVVAAVACHLRACAAPSKNAVPPATW